MAAKTKSTPAERRSELAATYFPDRASPTWEVAVLFPPQGCWTESDYFNLDNFCDGIPRVELSNGRLEVLPIPTELHQLIVAFLLRLLEDFTRRHAPGIVLPSGMRIKLKSGKYRDPDLLYMKAENAHRRRQKYWLGADLVMEVVSGSSEDIERDWKTKTREYARCGISEYWIIDPAQKVVCVQTLVGDSYKVHGNFRPGETAMSALLRGFKVSVGEIFSLPTTDMVED